MAPMLAPIVSTEATSAAPAASPSALAGQEASQPSDLDDAIALHVPEMAAAEPRDPVAEQAAMQSDEVAERKKDPEY